jgi:putative inorganic carbon (HCO3(-)) transporter
MRKTARSLANLEIWVVGIFVAASFATQKALPFAVGSVAVFWAVRWIAYSHFSVRTPADWPVAMLVLMVPVTLWATAELSITMTQVLRLLAGIGMFYAVINWTQTTNRLHWLLRGIWLAGLLIALYAFIGVQWNNTKLFFIPASLYSHFQTLVTDTSNPNALAAGLVILIPCSLGILFFYGRQLSRIDLGLSILSAGAVTFVLVLTQSRGGLLAFGVVLIMLIVLRWKRGWWVLVGAVVLASAVLIWLGPSAVLNGIMANVTLGGMDGRIEVWSRAIYMIQDFPFTGVGMGSYNRVADLLYPFFQYAPGTVVFSHNLFLQVAVDLGIPGLVAWLSILILIFSVSIQLYRYGKTSQNNWASGLGAGLLCSQLALVTHGMVDAATWGVTKSAPLVWIIWGLAVAGWYVYMRPKSIQD